MTHQRESGFTIVEMMIVMAVGATLVGIAMMASGSALTAFKARGVVSKIQATVNMARELSISQQRDMVLSFDTTANTISVIRQDKPSGTTTLSTIGFEGGLVFTQVSGTGTTPDAWGINTAATNGSNAVMFVDARTVQFRAGTGQLVDPSTWLPVNGRIFVGISGKKETAGMVSVFGATGRVRGYHWEGQWVTN